MDTGARSLGCSVPTDGTVDVEDTAGRRGAA
jgi:hypothetical protein